MRVASRDPDYDLENSDEEIVPVKSVDAYVLRSVTYPGRWGLIAFNLDSEAATTTTIATTLLAGRTIASAREISTTGGGSPRRHNIFPAGFTA